MRTVLNFRPGQRVELVSTDDPWTQLRPGDRGTIRDIDDALTVHVCWDSGSHLGMIVSWDRMRGKPGEVLDRLRIVDEPARFCPSCTAANELMAQIP